MNSTMREIQTRFKVTDEQTREIHEVLMCDVYFDASEFSQRQCNAAYDEAHNLWLSGVRYEA